MRCIKIFKKLPLIFCIIFVSFFSSCKKGDTPPNGVLSQEDMSNVMTDLYLVEGISQVKNITMDSPEKVELYRSVLAKHHITLKQYDNSLIWYAAHLKEYKKLNYKVEDRITSIKDSIDGKVHKIKKYDDN